MSNANGTALDSEMPPLNPEELGVLEACREVVARRQELLPLLAQALGVPERDVFYTWAFRRCRQRGALNDTGWVYFFHGYECDLEHTGDGRLLRLDFGPGGRVDTLTMWSVLQFIMTSTIPWPEYPELRQRFAKPEQRATRFAGNTAAFGKVWDSLQVRGALEPADPALIRFKDACTTRGADGLLHVRYPPGTPETTEIDCAVAHRPVLSPVGLRLLELHGAGRVG